MSVSVFGGVCFQGEKRITVVITADIAFGQKVNDDCSRVRSLYDETT